jgi:hypothetical protein
MPHGGCTCDDFVGDQPDPRPGPQKIKIQSSDPRPAVSGL